MRRKIYSLFFFGSALVTSSISYGQSASTYGFSASMGTYTEVSPSATQLTSVQADQVLSSFQNIGFNFIYEGITYTQFKMSSDGYISLGSGTSNLSGNNFSTANTTSRPIIAPLWDDLDGKATGGSYAGYEVTGSSPNQVLTVEWRNWEWNWNSTSPAISFQVKLYEATGNIEFIYRQESGTINNGGASIGIGSATGSGAGSYLNLVNIAAPTVSTTSSVTNINTKPPTGQVYTFINPPPCSGKPFAGMAAASSPVSGGSVCANLPFSLNTTGATVATGLTYEWQSNTGNGWTATGGTDRSYTVTGGISTATAYRLIMTCSNTNDRDTSNVIPIAIDTVNAFPWLYDVETQNTTTNSSITNDCWTSSPSNTSSPYRWDVDASGGTPSSNTGPNGAYSGSKYYYTEASSGSQGDSAKLITPLMDLSSLTVPQLAFYYHMYGAAMGRLIVQINNGSGWVSLDSLVGQQQTATNDPWLSRSVSLSGYTGAVNLRFVGIKGNNYTGDMSLDNIIVRETPSCPAPQMLTSANITPTSADISRVSATGAPQWQIEYGPIPYTQGTGQVVTANTNPYTLTGLSSGTDYAFFVRDICVPGDTSLWAMGTSFTTLCDTAQGPYSQSFNLSATPNCWTNSTTPEPWVFANAASTSTKPGYGVNGSDDHTGNGGYFAWVDGSGTGTNQDITLTSVPIDITGFSAPNLSYFMKSFNNVDAALNKLVVEVFDGSNWIQIDSVQQNYPDSSWYNRQVTLPPLSTNTIQVRFVVDEFNNNGGAAYNNDILIDDINITNGPLAIRLDQFSAASMGASNKIVWNTVSEEGSDRFELERSVDGKNFSQIYTKQANGKPSRYTYLDHLAAKGINYYRLRMVEANGTAVYSKVVSAYINTGDFEVQAFPNPVSDELTITVSGVQGTNPMIQVTDLTGKVIKTVNMDRSMKQVNMSGLASGIYLIKYADTNHAQTIRVHKQ